MSGRTGLLAVVVLLGLFGRGAWAWDVNDVEPVEMSAEEADWVTKTADHKREMLRQMALEAGMPMDKGRPQVMSHEERKTIMAKSAAPVRMDTPSEWESGEEEDLGEDEGWWWSHGGYDNSDTCPNGALTIPDDMCQSDGCYQGLQTAAFRDCSTLTSVTLPSSIWWIPHYSFDSCTALTSVTMTSNIYWTGRASFYGCSSLATLDLNNVRWVCNSAFSGCSSLSSVSMPNVWWIDWHAFEGCESLSSVTVPSNCYRMAPQAFDANTNVNGNCRYRWRV